MVTHRIISMSLPEAELAALDALVRARGYPGRSALLRDGIERVAEATRDPEGCGLLILGHDHDERVPARLQHEHAAIIRSSQHHHVEGRCADIMVLAGEPQQVRRLIEDARQSGLRTRFVPL